MTELQTMMVMLEVANERLQGYKHHLTQNKMDELKNDIYRDITVTHEMYKVLGRLIGNEIEEFKL